MYEIVKTVNGYNIERMVGSRGFYWVRLTENRQATFYTIKAAVAYIERNL